MRKRSRYLRIFITFIKIIAILAFLLFGFHISFGVEKKILDDSEVKGLFYWGGNNDIYAHYNLFTNNWSDVPRERFENYNKMYGGGWYFSEEGKKSLYLRIWRYYCISEKVADLLLSDITKSIEIAQQEKRNYWIEGTLTGKKLGKYCYSSSESSKKILIEKNQWTNKTHFWTRNSRRIWIRKGKNIAEISATWPYNHKGLSDEFLDEIARKVYEKL